MKGLVAVFILWMVTNNANAFFEFENASVSPFNWEYSEVNPRYTFTVNFRAFCNGRCTGQDYRLVLADVDPGSQSPVTPGSQPDEYEAVILSEYVLNINYQEGNSAGLFTPGRWSHQESATYFFQTSVNTSVTGTFTLELNARKLKTLAAGSQVLRFYVGGEDMYGTRHSDSIEISIPLVIPELVKISGLEDITLNAAGLNGGNLDADQQVCLFSNTGRVSLDFDGHNVPDENFQLAKSGHCSDSADCVSYRIRVRTVSENWLTFRRRGQWENSNRNRWSASLSEDCNGAENATIRVRIKRNDLNMADAGVYSDTMTVTVSPY